MTTTRHCRLPSSSAAYDQTSSATGPAGDRTRARDGTGRRRESNGAVAGTRMAGEFLPGVAPPGSRARNGRPGAPR
ncbi:hypothetical protein FAGKG844_10266 [Frankia sp. AgKG'84/4]